MKEQKKIIIEATEQSNQLYPPEISEIIKLKKFIEQKEKTSQLLFADVNAKNKIKSKDLNTEKPIVILIGPEGDFSPNERELIVSKATQSFSLSKNI